LWVSHSLLNRHIFCFDCILKCFETKLECPNCRHNLTKKSVITKDLLADSIINDLGVSCNNSNCPWMGVLSELDEHLKSCVFDKKLMPNNIYELLNKENTNTRNIDHSEPEESCVNSYLNFNSNTSLKARLYQKNPELIKSSFSSENKNTKEKDLFDFLDSLGNL